MQNMFIVTKHTTTMDESGKELLPQKEGIRMRKKQLMGMNS